MLSDPPHYLCRVGGVGGEVVPRWSRAGRWVRWVRWAGGWERARDRDRHSTKTKVPSELGVSAAALDGECGSAWRRRQCRSARREGGVLHAFVLWSRDLFTGSSCCTGRGQTKSKKCNQTDSNVKKSNFHKEATDQGTNDIFQFKDPKKTEGIQLKQIKKNWFIYTLFARFNC